jgi:phosphoribosylformylglycinamidine synthase
VYPDGTVLDIDPFLDITIVGGIPDARRTVTADFKRPGSTLVLVGTPDYVGMAGSIVNEVSGGESARVPRVDLDQLPTTLLRVHEAIQTGRVRSVKAIARGGLMATVAQMGFGGEIGVDLYLDRATALAPQLFSETSGCMVVEVDNMEEADTLFGDVPYTVIGATTAEKTVRIAHGDTETVMSLDRLKTVWKG